MAYRKQMSRSNSKRTFARGRGTKKINHVQTMGMRGGIRL